MAVVDVIQACKGMSEKKWASYYVEALHKPLGGRLTCLEGDERDHVVVPCLVFLEQVTKLVDWRFLELGRREDETAGNIHACFLSCQPCEMEEHLILKP